MVKLWCSAVGDTECGVKEKLLLFYTSVSVYRHWGVLLNMRKKLYKAAVSTGSRVKSDKLPRGMSLGSASVGTEEV